MKGRNRFRPGWWIAPAPFAALAIIGAIFWWLL
mgnify:CR=1 FL=1